MLRYGLKLLFFLAVVVASPAAFAGGGWRVAADAGANVDLDGTSTDLGVRFGRNIKLAVLHLTPEVGGRLLRGGVSPNAGVRVGVGKGVVPTVYAHYGYVLEQTPVPWFEAGAALDFTFVPKINFGPHASYTALGDDGFPSFGVHAGVTF